MGNWVVNFTWRSPCRCSLLIGDNPLLLEVIWVLSSWAQALLGAGDCFQQFHRLDLNRYLKSFAHTGKRLIHCKIHCTSGPCPPLPSVPDKDYLLCTSWHFLIKKWILGPYFIFFQKNFQPRFALHEYYSSFTSFWSHFAHYLIYFSFCYGHTSTLYWLKS